jgi:hypothetical protein
VALKVLEGLLVEDDEVLSVWYLIGWLEYLRGNLDESLEHLQRVVNVSWLVGRLCKCLDICSFMRN